MFGAPSASRRGSTRFLWTESFIVSPAVEADGVGGNGRISWAFATGESITASDRPRAVDSPSEFKFIARLLTYVRPDKSVGADVGGTSHLSCRWPMLLVCLSQPEDLRLHSLDRLADVGAHTELADGKLLERRKVLAGDADDRRQRPRLALVEPAGSRRQTAVQMGPSADW